MAIDQDGWFVDTFVKALADTIALDLGDTTPGAFKGALFTDDVTPDFDQEDPAYGSSPWDANEASGTGYSPGGADLTVTGWGQLSDAHRVGWSFDTVTWADSTISAAGLLVYCPSLSDRCVILRAFGQTYSTEAGDFEITFDPEGGAWRNTLRNTP